MNVAQRFARCAVVLAFTTVASAQSTWLVSGSEVLAVARGRKAVRVAPNVPTAMPAGDYQVHFPVGAHGKPRSLRFAVDDGDRVVVAVERRGAPQCREVPLDGSEWTQTVVSTGVAAGAPMACATLALDGGDQRVEVEFAPADTELGIVARAGADGHYRCLWSSADHALRLERVLGGDLVPLARTSLPDVGAGPHRLAVQTEGFRIQVWLDDELLLQALDGALVRGAFGICWRGARPQFSRFVAMAPVAAQASAALVQRAGTATVCAAVTVTPGHLYAIELARDWPYPLLPEASGGFEPWVLQRAAAPRIALADFSERLGPKSFGEVPVDGMCECVLAWPRGRALRYEAALLRVRLFAPTGEAVVGATAAMPVQF